MSRSITLQRCIYLRHISYKMKTMSDKLILYNYFLEQISNYNCKIVIIYSCFLLLKDNTNRVLLF